MLDAELECRGPAWRTTEESSGSDVRKELSESAKCWCSHDLITLITRGVGESQGHCASAIRMNFAANSRRSAGKGVGQRSIHISAAYQL